MAAAAGLFQHPQSAAAQALTGSAVTPMDSSSSGTSGTGDSSSDSATISANDFLTLLVTEMQNQDPTADTDPNEYIDQLVQVNSLEQLININQTLSTDLPASSTSSTGGSATTQDAAADGTKAGTLAAVHTPTPAPAITTERAPGNLSVPPASAAAQRVASALDGRHSSIPGFPAIP